MANGRSVSGGTADAAAAGGAPTEARMSSSSSALPPTTSSSGAASAVAPPRSRRHDALIAWTAPPPGKRTRASGWLVESSSATPGRSGSRASPRTPKVPRRAEVERRRLRNELPSSSTSGEMPTSQPTTTPEKVPATTLSRSCCSQSSATPVTPSPSRT